MYCIAGFRKVKSAQEFTVIANHNNRIRLTKNEIKRIDSNRSMLNKVLINFGDFFNNGTRYKSKDNELLRTERNFCS